MPILTDDTMETTPNLGQSGYGYSGTKMGKLGASEFTVVVLAADRSYSVKSFSKDIDKCIQSVVKSCGDSPRSDNLLLRLVTFDNRLEEVHGFKPLPACNPDDYVDVIKPRGATALFDATYNGVASMRAYGSDLYDADCDVNGILVVVTDGDDNSSTMTPMSIKKELDDLKMAEKLESVITILVGVNMNDQRMAGRLQNFSKDAGFDQFVSLDDASPRKLARLADFVSQSISAQSQALGTGGPSQNLTF